MEKRFEIFNTPTRLLNAISLPRGTDRNREAIYIITARSRWTKGEKNRSDVGNNARNEIARGVSIGASCLANGATRRGIAKTDSTPGYVERNVFIYICVCFPHGVYIPLFIATFSNNNASTLFYRALVWGIENFRKLLVCIEFATKKRKEMW